jgi:hypothetical protein
MADLYIYRLSLNNNYKINMQCETQRIFENEDVKVSPPTMKELLYSGYINHSTAALFFGTTQKLGVSEQPGKICINIYHIPMSPPLNK